MNPEHQSIAALIVAAGRGVRAGAGKAKQYRLLGGRSVLDRAVQAFLKHDAVGAVMVVIHPDDEAAYREAVEAHPKLLAPVHGGESRGQSVFNGLQALESLSPDLVLVHDAARPLVSETVISRVITALKDADGAVPTMPAVDAMRRIDRDGVLGESVAREGVCKAQTPQGFYFKKIMQLFDNKNENMIINSLADEAEAAIEAGLRVVGVPGDPANFKLTVPEDFALAQRLVAPAMRMGSGFDVHAFAEGDHVTLCGMKIPHNQGLAGHSDADVGLHAVTDALLGAIAAGDIGRHFPPSDAQWKGADSAVFLRRAVELVGEAGYGIGNLDVTLICEAPKIGPHADAMRSRIAEICGVDASLIGVKATTTEGLGFCGRGEGIAAQAVATVVRLS